MPAANTSITRTSGLAKRSGTDAAIAALKRLGSARFRDQMGPRFGITGPCAQTAFGVPMASIQKLASRIIRENGKQPDHDLALALWETGQYEARLLASMLGDPARLTSAQMDAWCRGFDNWGVVDTVCFKLFDRVEPALAFRKVDQWARLKGEQQRRAGFVMLACLALHTRPRDALRDEFSARLALIEKHAADNRNFVKKGVSWALRSMGRRDTSLRTAARRLAQRLAASDDAAKRWLGKDALRDLAPARK